MSENIDNVINKVKKLLSLSTSPNKEEAKLAYQKAVELMLKYNIESVSKTDKQYSKNIRYSNIETVEIKFIIQILLNSFFVQIVTKRVFSEEKRRLVNTYHILGQKTNLEIALYAYDFLLKELPRMWKVAKFKNKLTQGQRQSYYLGVLLGFVETFEEVKNYSEEKYGLVISKKDSELDRFVLEEFPNSKKDSRDRYSNIGHSATRIGVEDGKNLKINQAIETKNNDQVLMIS